LRVGFLEEGDLPIPAPAFQAFLESDGGVDFAELLVPDEGFDGVGFGEALDEPFAVFPSSAVQGAGNADIKRAVSLARQHVDVVATLHAAILAVPANVCHPGRPR
jgi:hypothetical protein